MAIYGSPSYQMGSVDFGASTIGAARQYGARSGLGAAQVAMGITPAEQAKAESELKKMRSSLMKWLSYRAKLGLPDNSLLPVEARLGKRLYVLLCEMFDAQTLPSEYDAVSLAKIAIAGKVPTELSTGSQQAVGMVFLWPLVAVVGLVMLTIVTKIKTDADDAADARRIECIKEGKCTDYGFWLKVGGIALVAWIAWDKFGLKRALSK
jgi:hypothetical protein